MGKTYKKSFRVINDYFHYYRGVKTRSIIKASQKAVSLYIDAELIPSENVVKDCSYRLDDIPNGWDDINLSNSYPVGEFNLFDGDDWELNEANYRRHITKKYHKFNNIRKARKRKQNFKKYGLLV
jgi:hypothetical protein